MHCNFLVNFLFQAHTALFFFGGEFIAIVFAGEAVGESALWRVFWRAILSVILRIGSFLSSFSSSTGVY